MRHIAVIGSGPAGYYTAEAARKQGGDGGRVDIIDRLSVPYGLIRSGVAPDHQSIKAVYRRYEATALSDNVRFVGNVTVGRDVTIAELRDLYYAVVLATGYSEVLAEWEGRAVAEVLGKPYRLEELAAALARAFASLEARDAHTLGLAAGEAQQ